jgi:hypothetical protein
MFPGSRRAEQLTLRSKRRIVATVEDSVLRTEMTGLESQEVNSPKRVLFFKPMRWLGQLRIIFQTQTLGGASYILSCVHSICVYSQVYTIPFQKKQTTFFFAVSGVQLPQHDRGQFHYRRAAFSTQLKSKCGNILAKTAALLHHYGLL